MLAAQNDVKTENALGIKYNNGMLAQESGRRDAQVPKVSFINVPVMPQQQSEDDGIDCSPCCNNDNIRRAIQIIFLGQILSICLCGTGVASELLQSRDVHTPAAQTFLSYFFICSIYGMFIICKRDGEAFFNVLHKRGWKYILLAFIDVEANYMIVYAYNLTTLTSIQLLDSSAIPAVLVLSFLFLSARYLITHIIGVTICLIGIAVLIWADVLEGKGSSGGSNRALGDVLCIAGSICYAIGNTGEEYLIKQNSRTEYLGMIGIFGSIISGIQCAFLEREAFATIKWSNTVIFLYLVFALCMFVFYSLVTVVMHKSSALMFNLSIQTADFFTLLFGLFFFKYKFHALYFLSFIVIIGGSIIYSIREPEYDSSAGICEFPICCCREDNEISSMDTSYTGAMSLPTLPSTSMNSPVHSNAAYDATNFNARNMMEPPTIK